MAAERRRPAVLDRRHDLQLGEAHVTGVGLSPCRPIGSKDVGDLQARPRHARAVRRAAIGGDVGPSPSKGLLMSRIVWTATRV